MVKYSITQAMQACVTSMRYGFSIEEIILSLKDYGFNDKQVEKIINWSISLLNNNKPHLKLGLIKCEDITFVNLKQRHLKVVKG